MDPVTKKTPLYEEHIKLGAKMAPFGGFDMPIQYEGIFKEHFATRESVTVFDTCHMGEFILKGENIVSDLENILTCAVSTIPLGSCRYGFICNEKGGVIDDQIIYRVSENEFFMVVNASTRDDDFDWIESNISDSSTAENLSESMAKIDIQGPKSVKLVSSILKDDITALKYYTFRKSFYKDIEVIVSRTGYTGEVGYEIYIPSENVAELWQEVLTLGAKPAGLGCRDTLRLEMGYPLYGHELDENRNPAESGFLRAIDTTKKFIGSSIINDGKSVKDKLAALNITGRKSARNGDEILDLDGNVVGVVTSGSFAPSIGNAIAFGYVKKEFVEVGSKLQIKSGRKNIDAEIVTLPFFKEGTCRKKIENFI